MSEVSKSGKGIVNYFKTNEALVPRSFRRSVKEIFRLVKSSLVCMAWACATMSIYLGFNPDQSPVAFEKEIGKIESAEMEKISDVDRFVVSLQHGEETTRFVNLNGLWICPEDVTRIASEHLSSELNTVQRQFEVDPSVNVVGKEIKCFSLTPSWK